MNKTAQQPEAEDADGHSQRYRDMLDRAEALVPTLADRAVEAETLRRLPPDTERDLHDSGLYRILQPRRIGGAQLSYRALIDFGAVLARGCASTAWNLTNLASHHWMLAMFPATAQDRVWNENPDALIASSFIFPAGKARAVDGGYLLSGRWPFSSGVDPSQWNMLSGIVAAEDGAEPDHRVFLVHHSDYEVIDTWDTSGLKGTGSNDVVCEDVFVPAELSVSANDLKGGPTPGSGRNPSALYQLPVFALFPLILSGVGLGIAEASYADYVNSIRARASKYSGAKLAELQSTQVRIGGVGARVDIARRVMLGICDDAMADARRGVVPDLERRMAYRRDVAYATNECIEAVDMVCAGSGAQALYSSNPLQRRFRDAHAVAAHIAFSMDAATSAHGRVALGLDTMHSTI